MKRREFITLLGGAAAWPLAVRAQQARLPVIGYLATGSIDEFASRVAAFRQGLVDTGYVEGRNVVIEYRFADGRYERLPALSADLVGASVDVIVALGPPSVRVLRQATSTVPVVFVIGTDPVRDGLVASLARPGGNLTGISFLAVDLAPKRLELVAELAPQAKLVGLMVNPTNAGEDRVVDDVQDAERLKGFQLRVLRASTENDIDAAFATLVQQRAGALIVSPDSFFTVSRAQILALASRHAVPAIYAFREFAASGGLASYGTSIAVIHRQAGVYAGRILKGEKAAELPVMQPTAIELVINLKTAKALGLEVSPALLARADEVID